MNVLPDKKVVLGITALVMLLSVFILITANIQRLTPREPTDEELAEGTGVKLNMPENTVEKILEKGELSPQGNQVKQGLVAELNGEAGILFENDIVQIYYLPPSGSISDSFTSEIKTTDIVSAKAFTYSWLEERGFSDRDICNLRITFGHTKEVREYLIQTGEEFNPVFDNC